MDSSPPRDPQGLWGHQQTISLKTNWFLHYSWFTLAGKAAVWILGAVSFCHRQSLMMWEVSYGVPVRWEAMGWSPSLHFCFPSLFGSEHPALGPGLWSSWDRIFQRGEWLVEPKWLEEILLKSETHHIFLAILVSWDTSSLQQWGWRNTSNLFCGWTLWVTVFLAKPQGAKAHTWKAEDLQRNPQLVCIKTSF